MAPKRKYAAIHEPMEGQETLDTISELANTSTSHNDEQRHKVQKLACVLHGFFKDEFQRMVSMADDRPVLYYYSCDGTPMRTHHRNIAKVKGITVRRDGKASHEFLAQIAFMRYEEGDCQVSSVAFAPPLPMTNGKSAVATFSAALEFMTPLRGLGHRGIAVHQYCFDRALSSSMSRLLQQHHRLQAPLYGTDETESKYLARLEWVESPGCSLHDTHNSLKWGLNFEALGPDVLQNVWIVFASLRNSFDLILQHLPQWLPVVVSWTPRDRLPAPERLTKLWTVLGLDEELVDLLANDLVLWWDPQAQVLMVAEEWKRNKAAMQELSAALQAIWHFKLFSDSRWNTIGCNCRTLTASLLTGLASIVDRVRTQTIGRELHINGWAKLGKEETRFVVLASVASYVADGALSLIFKDTRVALNADVIRDSIDSSLQWMEVLDGHVWEALALCHKPEWRVTAFVVRGEALSAAYTSGGYFHWKCLRATEQLPWTLGRGDVNTNLDELMAGPKPTQPTAQKIWELLKFGHSREPIVNALRLLLDAPWATSATEQAHVMGALVKRLHHELGAKALISRAMVGGFRKVFPKVEKHASELAKLHESLLANAAHVPSRVSGRHMFLGDFVRTGMAMRRPGQSKAAFRHTLMRRHPELYSKLSAAQVADYEGQALVHIEEKVDEHRQERETVLDKLAKVRQKQAEEMARRKPLTLTSCSLDASGVRRVHEAWTKGSQTGRDSIREQVANLCVAPALIGQDRYEALAGQPYHELRWMSRPGAQRPTWLAQVVAHRHVFSKSVWCLRHGLNDKYYKFLMAQQNPQQILFVPLTLVDPLDAPPATGSVDDEMSRQWDHVWEVHLGEWLDWTTLGCVDAAVSVFTPCRQVGHGRVVSLDEGTPLLEFLAALDPLPVKEPAPKRERPEVGHYKVTKELLKKCPRLEEDLGDVAVPPDAVPDETDEDEVEVDPVMMRLPARELEDEELVALWTRLEERRPEWQALDFGKHSTGPFKVKFLQGGSTKKITGLDADNALAYAVQKTTKDWCKSYKLPDNCRFGLRPYGEKEATILAQGWCSRMTHFLTIYTASGVADYDFTVADAESWDPPPDWQATFDTAPAKLKDRVAEVFNVLPSRR